MVVSYPSEPIALLAVYRKIYIRFDMVPASVKEKAHQVDSQATFYLNNAPLVRNLKMFISREASQANYLKPYIQVINLKQEKGLQ